MKKTYLISAGTLLLLLTTLTFFIYSGSNIKETSELKYLNKPSLVNNDKSIQVSFINTGKADSLEALMLAGGSIFRPLSAVHNVVLIRHPKGNILIDTGLGSNIDEDFQNMPSWARPFFQYSKNRTARQVLDQNKISIPNILLTHMHWDHTGGVEDFPESNIYTIKEEYDFAHSDKAANLNYFQTHFDQKLNWKLMELNSGPYEIFKKSRDFYGDGTIVIVPLYGHSIGSVGIFLNISDKDRYFFTGDLTWLASGFQQLSHKNCISSKLVDLDKAAIEAEISRIAKFLKENPDIKVVPTHDSQAYRDINELK